MKILTIGASPYLLVRNGKINSDIIEKLVSEGHEVSSTVWHHDEGYFMPSDEGVHSYEKNGKILCTLFPFTPKTDEASPHIYELMKSVQPQLVITIGDYKDTNFIYAIKSMYPTLFKWIAVYTVDSKGISNINKDAFEYADYVVTTSEFGLKDISSFANIKGEFVPYGPNHEEFYCENKQRDMILCSSRNAQTSNLPAFISSVSDLETKSYIHTNLYDPGDYNIDSLKNRYNANNLSYTEDYCSVKEGISIDKLRGIYNQSHIIVDCSIKSATGLSLLEGMACGCIPVGPNYGRVGEIISKMPEGMQFYIPYNIFTGQNEEELAIVSSQELSKIIRKILSDKELLEKASNESIKISSEFCNKKFLNKIISIIDKVNMSEQCLALHSF